MKLNEKFIPLILEGKKENEFRNDGTHFNKIYHIADKKFFLALSGVLLKEFCVLEEKEEKYFLVSYEFGIEKAKYLITKQEFDWLKENWDSYFGNTIWIASWIEAENETLEVIK